MTSQTVKIKNGMIDLPAELQKDWREADVDLRVIDNTLIVRKRGEKQPFWDTWKKLQKVGQDISQQDIDEAVKLTRAQRHASRS